MARRGSRLCAGWGTDILRQGPCCTSVLAECGPAVYDRRRERAVEAGAVPKLLKLVDHEDEGALNILCAFCLACASASVAACFPDLSGNLARCAGPSKGGVYAKCSCVKGSGCKELSLMLPTACRGG